MQQQTQRSSRSPARPRSAGRTPKFGTRCLADVVPIEHADRVAVLGRTRDLRSYLRERGVDPSVLPLPRRGATGAAPLAPRFEVVIVSAICPRRSPLSHAVLRHAGPGGHLLLGGRSRWRTPWRSGSWTPGQARRFLQQNGFTDVRVYGVRRSLRSPRFLVPLDDAPAQRWFMRAAFLPETRLGAVVARAFAVGPLVHVTSLLFRDLVFVARRLDEQVLR